MTIRKVQFVIVSLILFPLLLLQSSSGALTLSDTPPWDDLEKALLQLAGAEAEFESSERKIEEKERELSDLLRAEDKEEAL